MLAKLLTLLSASKGAAVAAAVVLGAATVTVGASSPDVQDTVSSVVQTVTGQTTVDTAPTSESDCEHGQPAVVAQRNAATKLIDAAFQKDHKALEELRGKGVDNKTAGDLIKSADRQLKDLRTKALNDVAALTLGREGQNNVTPPTQSSPCLSTATETEDSAEATEPETESGDKPGEEGRVTVADRTTLDADVKAIVDKAVADMDAVVTAATAKLGALPAPERGKPEGEGDHGQASDKSGDDNHGKPSETPKH